MSVHHSKLSTGIKIYRGKSIPNYKNNIINIQNEKNDYNDDKIMENIPNFRMDYNNNNIFRNNDDEYYKYNYFNSFEDKYNRESSSSYITSDYEDMYINYFPNKIDYNYNYNDDYNKRISSPQINKSPLINNYLKMNSPKIRFYENSYNDENLHIYFENEENKNEIINYDLKRTNKELYSPKANYNQFQNTNLYPPPNNIININKQIENQNILSKSQNFKFLNEKNINKKKQNKKQVNNNTTNNTYNNNIYYINNPINVNNNKKIKEKNNIINNNFSNYNSFNCKKYNNKRNLIYKSVDFSNNNNENINNKKYKSKKDYILKAVILIQRVFRGYLLKIKLYNNVNLYICCKRGVYILEHLFLSIKKKEFYKLKKIIYSHKLRNSMNSPFSIKEKSKSNSCLKFYNINKKKKVGKNNENNSLIKSINIFRQELRDSFNIINRNIKKEENNEKKLKSKLNDVIKENKELKNKLIDNKNIKEKIKNLIDENIKNHNINTIIMRDNKQLAKKLKDFQEYRNNKLIIEIQPSSFYLIKEENNEKIKYQELKLSKEFLKNKLKIMMLEKLINKRMKNMNNLMKQKIYKFKNVSKRLNKISQKRIIYLTKIFDIIGKYILLKINKCFWILFRFAKQNQIIHQKIKEINEMKKNLKKEKLKKIISIFEQKKRNNLYKYFCKIIIYNIRFNINKKNQENQEFKKLEKLKKIFIKYEKNVKLIYKIFLEKWNLSAKIIGMRNAARDKKKKRKLKKKNNKLLYNKNFIIIENKNKKYNDGQKLCKSSNEFSIMSNGIIVKDSISKSIKENKNKTKSLNKKEMKNKNNILNKNLNKDENFNRNLYNINTQHEESNEDSGDFFEFENNSD